MYEHLSGGVDFNDPDTIRRAQVHQQFLEWIGEEDAARRPITLNTITHGEANRWLDRLSVHARLGEETDLVEDIVAARDRTHAGLSSCVERWAAGERLGFDHYFEQELSVYGPTLWKIYWQRVFKVGAMMNDQAPFDPDVAMATGDAEILVVSFKRDLERRGVVEDERLPTIAKFFSSDAIKQTPFLRISSAMFAAMAVEASLQQAPKPDRGMMTDIATVSTLLPYCDAMFIDNRCHRVLKAATTGADLVYDARVFSLAARDAVLAWLDELEASAPAEHLALVDQVYGESWLEPYSAIYEPSPQSERPDLSAAKRYGNWTRCAASSTISDVRRRVAATAASHGLDSGSVTAAFHGCRSAVGADRAPADAWSSSFPTARWAPAETVAATYKQER